MLIGLRAGRDQPVEQEEKPILDDRWGYVVPQVIWPISFGQDFRPDPQNDIPQIPISATTM